MPVKLVVMPVLATLAYAVAVLAAPYLPLGVEISTLMAAPFYFLLPMGVGLFVLSFRRDLLAGFAGRASALIWAYFVGLMLVTSIFVAREHDVFWRGKQDYWFALICVGSLAGFIRSHRVYAFDAGLRTSLLGALLIAPFFIYSYGIQYFLFSDYPYTDLFQLGHLMKGAGEFARFDRLNPFTADSYAPVVQVILGLEIRFLGVDPLFSAWAIPLPAFLLRYLVCYNLARQIVSEWRGQILLAGGLLILVGGLIPTNGDMATWGSMLLLSMMLQRNRQSDMSLSRFLALPPLAGMFAGLLVAQHSVLAYLAILLTMLVVIVVAGNRGPVSQRLMLMAVLAYALAPLHRSSLLFIPLAVLLGWLYAQARSGIRPKWRTLVSCAYHGLPPLALTISLFILWRHSTGAVPQFNLLSLDDAVFRALLGVSVINNQDALLGQGSTVALFEITRNIGGVLVLIAGSVFLAGWRRKIFKDQGGTILVSRRKLYISPRLALIFGMSAIIIMLAGIPFVYRASFFPILLLGVFCIPAVVSAAPALMRYWGWATVLYVVIAAAIYGLFDATDVDPFVAQYRVTGLIVAGAIAVIGVLVAMRIGNAGRNAWAVPILLLALIAWDKETARVYFKHYAYGYPSNAAQVTPVTHFTAEDFRAASWLIRYTGDIYVLSDPVTMSNLRALAGRNSVVTYSNLDTMSETARKALQMSLKAIVTGGSQDVRMDPACDNDAVIRRVLAKSGHSAELNYTLMRRLRPELNGTKVLSLLGYADGLLVNAYRDTEADVIGADSPPLAMNNEWIRRLHMEPLPVKKIPTDARLMNSPKEFFPWIGGDRLPGSRTAASDAPGVKNITAVAVFNHRTMSWLNDPGRRVDYFFTNERLDDSVRDRLASQCNGISLDDGLVVVPLSGPTQ